MSNQILPGKLGAKRTVSVESPIIVEKKKKSGKGLLLFLMAVGLGAVALASISLLAPMAFYSHVDSPGSIDDTSSRGDAGAVITGALAASATATDGNGVVIENNGLTESDEMTIAGYSDSDYSKELKCALDSLPAYCSGSNPVTLSGLPPGEHTFTVVEPHSDEITAPSFSWEILE